MKLGFVGLGKMGGPMVERLMGGGHEVIVYGRTRSKVEEARSKGAEAVESLAAMVKQLAAPRVVWMMVPAGDPVSEVIDGIVPHLSRGDIIVDGGNSYYKDSIRRAGELTKAGLLFVDVGTSGGVWGLRVGYCMMVGGEDAAVDVLAPALTTLAPPEGWAHVGASGAGHQVKMIHNGIEYGIMQAYAEGFDILKASPYGLDLRKIAHLWNQGSVIRSWLLELAERAFAEDPGLEKIKGYVADSGEGRWTILEAMERDVPAPVITHSLFERFHSRRDESFAAKVLAALRNQFGGHAVKTK